MARCRMVIFFFFFLSGGNKDDGSQGGGRAGGQGNNSPGGEASKVTTQRWQWQEQAAATREGNCHPRPGTHTLQCLGLSTCNRGWRPGAESGRR